MYYEPTRTQLTCLLTELIYYCLISIVFSDEDLRFTVQCLTEKYILFRLIDTIVYTYVVQLR